MPGKPRHGKRNHLILSKRRKESQRSLATASLPRITAQTSLSATATDKAESKISKPMLSKKPAAGQYDYVIAEMKMIGILTGIVLVILFVLALVL